MKKFISLIWAYVTRVESLIEDNYPFTYLLAGIYIAIIWPVYLLLPILEIIEKGFDSE